MLHLSLANPQVISLPPSLHIPKPTSPFQSSTMTSTIFSEPNPNSTLELVTPTISHMNRPTHLNTSGMPGLSLESRQEYSESDQREKILEIIRSRNAKIAVISNGNCRNSEEDKLQATSIATELNKRLSGSKVLVYEYVIENAATWFEYLQSVEVTYYIFINLPLWKPYQNSSSESQFFSARSQRITDVVVVGKMNQTPTTPGGNRSTTYTPVHYLERFQHLSGSPMEIAIKSLCHFAGELRALYCGCLCVLMDVLERG